MIYATDSTHVAAFTFGGANTWTMTMTGALTITTSAPAINFDIAQIARKSSWQRMGR